MLTLLEAVFKLKLGVREWKYKEFKGWMKD